jgi:hypothetical protein
MGMGGRVLRSIAGVSILETRIDRQMAARELASSIALYIMQLYATTERLDRT